MNNIDILKNLFEAIVIPVFKDASFEEVETRMKELEPYPSFQVFLNNKNKLMEKIKYLEPFLRMLENDRDREINENNITPWINNWFNRMNFIDYSIIHSIPEELKDLTKIIHRIMILYAMNNKDVILHGSFAAHLIDHRIKYADIDFSCLLDDLVFLTSLLLYIFLGIKTHILSIPYIINHRQLRVDKTTTSISDALKIDIMTKQICHALPIRVGKIFLNAQNPITQFFNYFKMLHLSFRRSKIKHYLMNQKLILNTIYNQALYQLGYNDNSFLKIIPYDIQINASEERCIRMRLTYKNLYFNIVFHTGYQDYEFLNELTTKIGVENVDREMFVFHPLCSLFPEQCVEVIKNGESTVHINISRNEVYRSVNEAELRTNEVSEIIIDPYSVLNMLSIVGLHYFFSKIPDERIIPPHTRILRTILEYCNNMIETPNQMLYDRIKNSGNHIMRNIYAYKPYLPYIKNVYPITQYMIPMNKVEMILKGNYTIEEYNYATNNFRKLEYKRYQKSTQTRYNRTKKV